MSQYMLLLLAYSKPPDVEFNMILYTFRYAIHHLLHNVSLRYLDPTFTKCKNEVF